MESEEQLLYKERSSVDDAGKGQERRWNSLSLAVLAVVVTVLLSSLLLFACVVSKGSSSKTIPTVETFTSPPCSPSFDDQRNTGLARDFIAGYITRRSTRSSAPSHNG
ncbi:hypothetical protein MTO96_041658 [Rhipicephalus appendiculatus]